MLLCIILYTLATIVIFFTCVVASKIQTPSMTSTIFNSAGITCTCTTGCHNIHECICYRHMIMCSHLCHSGQSCFNGAFGGLEFLIEVTEQSSGKTGEECNKPGKTTETCSEPGKSPEECSESGKMAETCSKPGRTAEECSKPGKMAEECKLDKMAEVCTKSGAMNVDILTTDHHQNLNSTMWLDDTLINLGQNMLLKQHPQINGLQSTLLGQNFGFSPMPFEFVQILHENENHWITISTIGCPASEVNIYDSLHGTLSMHNQRVIADILQTQKEFIFFQYQDVQWQSNAYDCGLFALAFATSLCNGRDPSTVVYQQKRMTEHFHDCIECGVLSPFPFKKKRKGISKTKTIVVEVFCLCRQPDYGARMIECDCCKSWYHTSCVKVPYSFLRKKNKKWHCPLCENK